MALHALTLLTHSRLFADIELHQSQAKLIVLPPPCPHSISPIDFDHAAELIDRSAQDARAFLDTGGSEPPPARKRNSPPRRGRGKKPPAGVTKGPCPSLSDSRR